MNKNELNKIFVKDGPQVLFSVAPQTRLWATGVAASDGFTLIEKSKTYLFVDSRYIEYAKKYAKKCEVILLQGNSLAKFFEDKKYQRIAFEEDYLLIKDYNSLSKWNPQAKFFQINGQKLRILKTDSEIKLLQKAIDISLSAFEEVKSKLVAGVSEKQVASLMVSYMKRHGAEKESFDTIVAFGPSSAEPHHHPTDKLLHDGDIVKIDFGAIFQGYCSDITRTFIFNKNSETNLELVKILDIVEKAAAAGRAAVKPGIKTKDIDKICRKLITKAGYGDKFLHSTGHGLGIDVHELPNVSGLSEIILEPGMVITVEPGIYLEGLGGARIEDDVLVTESGSITLSRKIKK